MKFKIQSEFSPTGDQPLAIKKLAEGYRRCVNYRMEIQHGRSVSDMVKNWTEYDDANLRIRKRA